MNALKAAALVALAFYAGVFIGTDEAQVPALFFILLLAAGIFRERTVEQQLTPKEKTLLDWLQRTPMVLESQIVGSGLSKALDELLLKGLADMVPHPTVVDRKTGRAATAFVAK